MHAILLFGGPAAARHHQTIQTATQTLKTSPQNLAHHPDAFLVGSEDKTTSITIAVVRELKTWLSRSPLICPQKVVLIEDADLLTIPAQHALLKSLEEPPSPTVFILTTSNSNLLLPTIRSRCQLARVPSSPQATSHPQITALLQKLSAASPGEKILLARNVATSKDAAIDFCRQLLDTLRFEARHHTIRPLILKATARALKFLSQNVNPKLVVEDLFLKL
ncbi:MAG: hypothetical protein HYS86_02210 [Candidatus Chisholmbacteria bacterium]|nr:hypothetical protein [Candidatus Chisholmbacteria bacterium]